MYTLSLSCQEISYIIYHTVDTLGCFLTKEISLKLWDEWGKEKIGKKERKIWTSKEKKDSAKNEVNGQFESQQRLSCDYV